MLLFMKYSPKKLDDLAGNEEARTRIRQWILNWMRGKKQRPLLVHGPTGIGKTSVAYALMREYDLELLEMNASDLRNKEHIERVLANALSAGSLSGKGKIILIDDVDALQRADSGGSSAVVKILKANAHPIIVTASDIWEKKLAGIRAECEQIPLRRVSKPTIAKILRRIADSEGMKIADDTIIDNIANDANGDVRSAINDLHAMTLGMRDREKDIFERVRTVFKAEKYSDAKKASQGDVEYNILKLWIDENIPAEYDDPDDLAKAYDMLSRADVFEGRIPRRNNWTFLKYLIDLMTVGVALSKKKQYHKFTRYQFPRYLKEMSATAARRAILKEIGRKIGELVHCNRKDALEYLHLLRHWAEKNQIAVMDHYRLTEEEIAFILEVTVEEIKKKKGKKIEEVVEEEPKEKKRLAETKDEEKKSVKKEVVPEIKKGKKKNSGTLLEFI
jgi:replication factor C large subunit